VNWEASAKALLNEAYRRLAWARDDTLKALIMDILSYPGVPSRWREPELEGPQALILPMELNLDDPSLDDQGNPFMGCDCHIQLVFRAWKSGLHFATLTTTTKYSTLCYLYGRMLLTLLTSALSSPLRVTVWQQHRELSLFKFVRHCQANADHWFHCLFQSPLQITTFLSRLCAAAARLQRGLPHLKVRGSPSPEGD